MTGLLGHRMRLEKIACGRPVRRQGQGSIDALGHAPAVSEIPSDLSEQQQRLGVTRPAGQRGERGVPGGNELVLLEQLAGGAEETQLRDGRQFDLQRLLQRSFATCGQRGRLAAGSTLLGQLGQSVGRVVPRPMLAGVSAGELTFGASLIAVHGHVPQQLLQGSGVRFQQPAVGDERHPADLATEHLAHGRNMIARRSRHEIIGGAARRDDHRPTTSHRFQHGQPEAFAAIRMHEAIARGVKSRQLLRRKLLVEIKELRGVGLLLQLANLLFQRLASVNRLTAKIFDHQTDIVFCREGFDVSLEQHIRAFAMNGAADKEELERLVGREFQRRNVRLENLGINPVRDDVNFFRRHTAVDIDLPDIVRRHPEGIDVLRRNHPVLRQRAEFPGLDHREFAGQWPAPIRRPRVTDRERGVGIRLRRQLAAIRLQRLGELAGHRRRLHPANRCAVLDDQRVGQNPVDVGETAVVEERAQPVELEFVTRRCGQTRSTTGIQPADLGPDCLRHVRRQESVILVKPAVPAARKLLQVFRDMVEPAGGFALEMEDDAGGLIADRSSGRANAQAEIDVLDAIAIHFVEAAEGQKEIARHEEARARDHVQVPRRIHFRRLRRRMAMRMIRHPFDPTDARVLDRAVRVQEFCANDTDLGPLRCCQQGTGPARSHNCIVIEEENKLAARNRCPLIAGVGKAEVARVADESQPTMRLRFAEKCGRAVG